MQATADEVVVALPDPLTGEAGGDAERRILHESRGARAVAIDLAAVERVDTFGLAGLAAAMRRLRAAGRAVRLVHEPPRVQRLATLLHLERVLGADPAAGTRAPRLERLGLAGRRLWDEGVLFLAMLAEGYRVAVTEVFRGGPVAREQLIRQLAQVGAGAVPIVALINFLVGLILALQSAYVLKDYGATIFMARGVAISITREIGPLMAALLVAGRSGSAIAAELGTMKVTEEVDALEMMALDPRRFLLAPRFLALSLAVPALCVVGDVAGLLGGMVVGTLRFDIGWYTYYLETLRALHLNDIASGLVKSFFFGNLIAVVGCLQGLTLRGGPEAVGRAATTAVVRSITAVVLFDAAFTTLTHEVL